MAPWRLILAGAVLAVVAAIPLWTGWRQGVLYQLGPRGRVARWREPGRYWRGMAISASVVAAGIGMMVWGLAELERNPAKCERFAVRLRDKIQESRAGPIPFDRTPL